MRPHRYTTPEGSQKPWNGFQLSWLSADDQALVLNIVERVQGGDVEVGAVAYWMFTVLQRNAESPRYELDKYAVELTKRHRLSVGTLIALNEATKDHVVLREQQ